MKKFFLCFSLLIGIFVIVGITCQASVPAGIECIVEPEQDIIIHEIVWPQFNWASFDKDKLVSFVKFQYAVYWDADKGLVVVRRNLLKNKMQVLRFPSYTLTIFRMSLWMPKN